MQKAALLFTVGLQFSMLAYLLIQRSMISKRIISDGLSFNISLLASTFDILPKASSCIDKFLAINLEAFIYRHCLCDHTAYRLLDCLCDHTAYLVCTP